MLRLTLAALLLVSPALAAGPTRIAGFDEDRFRVLKDKASVEIVDGQVGKAARFRFADGCKGAFIATPVRGQAEWDEAAGFSFLVRGDGSAHFGCLHFIFDEDYSVRYDLAFPLRSKEWMKVTVAWADPVPILPGEKSRPLDPKGVNRPSKLSALWVGKWWYWRDEAAHSFDLDELTLEPTINRPAIPRPEGDPLARVRAKLKAGKPVTVLTLGDSLTDSRHWANRDTRWPELLRQEMKEKYGTELTVVNPAVGGTQLRQGMVTLPESLAATPDVDLVTVFYGGNDWDAGMRGPQFRETVADAVDRIRRATGGKAEVLVLTTAPAVERWETGAELAEACRKACADRNAGLADVAGAFRKKGATDRERLFVKDKVHLAPAGHALVARTVLTAIRPQE